MRKEVTLAPDLVVIFREVSAIETMRIDNLITPFATNGYNRTLTMKCYAICHVDRINGEQVLPLDNELEFRNVFNRFTELQLGDLMEAYLGFMGECIEAADPKGGTDVKPPVTS